MTSETGARAGRLPRGTTRSSPTPERELGRPFRAEEAKLRRRHPIEEFVFEPHHCFACGELNEHGLRLALHADANSCWTEVTLEPRFQGWEAVAHGGIVCTLLDEVMAWSVIGRQTWGVTARLAVAFRRPVPIGRPLRAEGWVAEDRRRTFRTESRLLDAATGEVLATGEGTFVAAPPDQLASLKARYRLRPAADGADRFDSPPWGGAEASPGDLPESVDGP